jgi:hypothetical protein
MRRTRLSRHHELKKRYNFAASEMERRAAVEPVIGHLKAERRMDRNYLKGRGGERDRYHHTIRPLGVRRV